MPSYNNRAVEFVIPSDTQEKFKEIHRFETTHTNDVEQKVIVLVEGPVESPDRPYIIN